MGKECFTCKYKMSRVLTKQEQEELQREHVARTGRKSLFIPDMEFRCAVQGGKKIQQIDPACEQYLGDEFMERVRGELAKTARKLREELGNSLEIKD